MWLSSCGTMRDRRARTAVSSGPLVAWGRKLWAAHRRTASGGGLSQPSFLSQRAVPSARQRRRARSGRASRLERLVGRRGVRRGVFSSPASFSGLAALSMHPMAVIAGPSGAIFGLYGLLLVVSIPALAPPIGSCTSRLVAIERLRGRRGCSFAASSLLGNRRCMDPANWWDWLPALLLASGGARDAAGAGRRRPRQAAVAAAQPGLAIAVALRRFPYGEFSTFGRRFSASLRYREQDGCKLSGRRPPQFHEGPTERRGTGRAGRFARIVPELSGGPTRGSPRCAESPPKMPRACRMPASTCGCDPRAGRLRAEGLRLTGKVRPAGAAKPGRRR